MLIFSVTAVQTIAQQRLTTSYLNYIDDYKDIAIEQQRRYGIPASITLAQGLLESQAGTSRLAVEGNNHFGIKCNNGWKGKTIRHDDDEEQECFRSYKSAAESYNDHSLFLKRKRYEPLFKLKITDYEAWAKTLRKCGYATDPKYPEKLIGLIELYELYQYDDPKNQAVIDSTDKTEKDEEIAAPDDQLLAQEIGTELVVRRRYGLYFVIAREGDTFKSLGKELDVKDSKLAKFNDMKKNDAISAGDIIWVETKAKSASGDLTEHVVKEGETLHGISQRYGIQLKSLAKINKIKPNAKLTPGDIIVLQKAAK